MARAHVQVFEFEFGPRGGRETEQSELRDKMEDFCVRREIWRLYMGA